MQALSVEEPASVREGREEDRRQRLDGWPAELRVRADLLEMFALRHSIEWTQARDVRASTRFRTAYVTKLARC